MALAAFGATILYRWNPATAGFYPTCPFLTLTGWYCPGCGSLRAMHQLLHGNLGAAFDLNPLLLMTLPLVAWELAARLLDRPGWSLLSSASMSPVWVRAMGASLVAFGFLRNLPQYPFTLLAP